MEGGFLALVGLFVRPFAGRRPDIARRIEPVVSLPPPSFSAPLTPPLTPPLAANPVESVVDSPASPTPENTDKIDVRTLKLPATITTDDHDDWVDVQVPEPERMRFERVPHVNDHLVAVSAEKGVDLLIQFMRKHKMTGTFIVPEIDECWHHTCTINNLQPIPPHFIREALEARGYKLGLVRLNTPAYGDVRRRTGRQRAILYRIPGRAAGLSDGLMAGKAPVNAGQVPAKAGQRPDSSGHGPESRPVKVRANDRSRAAEHAAGPPISDQLEAA